MNNWVEGKLNKKEDGYYIDDEWILFHYEKKELIKGVELLCKKYKFESVLELGFGAGWTSTKFQNQGIKRHVILEPNKDAYKKALEWNKNYNAEILNIFSWEYEPKEKFDLIYDDIVFIGDIQAHKEFIKKFKNQWYTMCAGPAGGISQDDPIEFNVNNIKYRQNLRKL